VLDVCVERNAYGRQVDSFTAPIDAPVLGGRSRRVHPRAAHPPRRRCGRGDRAAPAAPAGEPVGVRAGRVWACASIPS
jgi:glutamine amidotransferase PdxT